MIFDNIAIIDLVKKERLAYYKFNKVGINVILGEKNTNDDDTNGVGKTALCLAVRYCISEKLPAAFVGKSEFVKHNAHVILNVIINGKQHRIRRCLYDDSVVNLTDDNSVDDFSSVGWNIYTKADFATYIQNIMYKNISPSLGETIPSFASVCELLMRDEKQGYATDIYLPNRQKLRTSKCLAFLSSMQCNFEEQLSLIKAKIKELNKEKEIIETIGKDIKNIREKHKETLNEINVLKEMLSNASVERKIEYDQKKYIELKQQINNIQRQINQLEFSKNQHEKNISNLEDNLKKAKEFVQLEIFYNQILNYFPEQLICNYEQMCSFYQSMLDDRGKYFTNQINKIKKKLNVLYNQNENYLKELSDITLLMKGSELVSDLQTISNQINEKHQVLAEYEFKIKSYSERDAIFKQIENEKNRFKKEKERLKEAFELNYSVINNIQSYFGKFINVSCLTPGAINGELQYSFEDSEKANVPTGRINIKCNLSDQDSYGRGNLKIILFDLSLLLNRIDTNIGLNFLFHDGPYVQITNPKIKFNILCYINDLLHKKGKGQYFVTMNVEELQTNIKNEDGDSINIIEYFKNNESTVATLLRTEDSEQRCMGFRY